jgi:HupE / UreJ protein
VNLRASMWALAALSMLGSATAQAHTGGSSFMSISQISDSRFQLQVDIDLRDVSQAVLLDRNGDASLTWGEVLQGRAGIEALLALRTAFSAGGQPCRIQQQDDWLLAAHGEGDFLRVKQQLDCSSSHLAIDDSRWFAVDPLHRSLLEYRPMGAAPSTAILTADTPGWQAGIGRAATVRRFAVQGMHHLFTGYDHLAFLGVLLVGLWRRGRDGSRLAPRAVLGAALRVITAFTVAHSLTLALAAMNILRVPSGPVEATIAASVVVAALLNLSRRGVGHGWKIAFAFGLVHGLGFASALAELVGRVDFLGLAAFNVGIELAQLVIAAAVLPLLWWLFRRQAGERLGIPVASLAIAALAAVWLFQRLQVMGL